MTPARDEARRAARAETYDQRMDRNFTDLLQELRVLQTGTQILAGFLLTLPFQARFDELTAYQRGLFMVAVALAFATAVVLVGPVSIHRSLFRQHRKDALVHVSHRLARVGLFTLATTLSVGLCLVFTVVVDTAAGVIAGVLGATACGVIWWGLPYWLPRSNGAGSPAP